MSPSPLAGEGRERGRTGQLDPSDKAIGRAQPPSPQRLTASQRPVFLLNSRLGLFTAALSGLHPNRAPLLPKLRGLTRIFQQIKEQHNDISAL